MTFNRRDNNNLASPMLYSSPEYLISQIEKSYLDLSKCFNELKEFARKLPSFSKKEYEKNKDNIHYKIQVLPSIIQSINSDCEKITSSEAFQTNTLDAKLREKLTLMGDVLSPKIEEVPNLIAEIWEKEKLVSLKLRNINISESKLDDSLSFLHQSKEYRESRLIFKEIIDNQEYLEKRREELETIKKISSQLREITNFMGMEVKIQGEKLNQIEEDMNVANKNVVEAEKVIIESTKSSSKHLNKVLCITSIIILVVLAIAVIMVLIFIGN